MLSEIKSGIKENANVDQRTANTLHDKNKEKQLNARNACAFVVLIYIPVCIYAVGSVLLCCGDMALTLFCKCKQSALIVMWNRLIKTD